VFKSENVGFFVRNKDSFCHVSFIIVFSLLDVLFFRFDTLIY